MQKSLSLFAAISAIVGRSVGPNFFTDAVSHSRPRWRQRVSKRYPEQSSRQALRGSRRAQGGPGIVLAGNHYVVREMQA